METARELRAAQQPSYPLVFHYFWEHLNEEDIQSATCHRGLARLQRRERQSISLNQYCCLLDSQTKHTPRSQVEVESLLPLWFEVVAAEAASILKSANFYYQTEFDQMVIITDLPQS